MNFGLRRQLLLIGLATLALPLASALYIRETEQALRDAQAGFLIDLARGLVPVLADALPPLPAGDADEAVFAYPLAQTPSLDGFSDDWRLDAAHRPGVVGGDRLRLLAGVDRDTLWLHALVEGSNERPVFELACTRSDSSLAIAELAPEAPGELAAVSNDADLIARLRGNWQPGDTLSRLELRIPGGLCSDRIGLLVSDNGSEARSYRGSMPGALIRQSVALSARLDENRLPGIEAWVVDRFGWRITPIIGEAVSASNSDEASGFSTRLYRRLLGDQSSGPTLRDAAFQFSDVIVANALDGKPSSTRLTLLGDRPDAARAVTVAAYPLASSGRADSVLMLRQDSAAILTLNNPSLLRLTNTIVLITLLVVTLLLAFATWLSWRVRRLAKAASTALDKRGRIRVGLPGRNARDEIGSLTRDVESLLGRVAEHQRYLRTMADTLSHELRTPLAVVQSSLDNLDHSPLDDAQRTLSRRAADGVQRLRAILNAMSSANRAEQAAMNAESATLDISRLVTQLHEAYRATFTTHQFDADIAADAYVIGNAELLVQLLDKLVENAVQFAPPGSTVRLALEKADEHLYLSVRNTGPRLPDIDPASLFDTFVSHRGEQERGSHLGFGLYVARLITDAHGGTIAAANWQEGEHSGVEITITLARTNDVPPYN